MKSGSGPDDPFAEFDDDEDGTAPDSEDDKSEDTDTAGSSLPWIYARDNAKAGREMTQFFLQEETEQMESDAVDELEDRFSDNEVRAFDVREAAYQVALDQHLDDVAAKLREWGYDQK